MALEKNLIDEVIGQHPARKLGFDELYSGLLDQVAQGFISRSIKDDLELFNYTPATMFEQNWNIFTLMSRGLILQPVAKRVVATPFPKFFNYGEVDIWDAETHKGEILALEKLDGSLGIVYQHNGEWHCATRGSFVSEQARWGREWLLKNLDTEAFEPGHTYLFEIIYAENRVVVPYDFEGMILLSAYCHEGFEYDLARLQSLSGAAGVQKAQHYPYENIHHFVKKAEEIDKNNEGWVIRFANGHRVKIKGGEYCRVHRLISNVTPLAVWELLMNMEDIEAIRRDLPEEHLKDFDIILKLLKAEMDALVAAIKASVAASVSMTDKDVGLAIGKGEWPDGRRVAEVEQKFLFLARKYDLEKELRTKGKKSQSLYNYIKPKANILSGYTPSKAIDRFQREALQG